MSLKFFFILGYSVRKNTGQCSCAGEIWTIGEVFVGKSKLSSIRFRDIDKQTAFVSVYTHQKRNAMVNR